MSAVADKVVLITGSATGCGRVPAEAFASEGAKVVGCDTNADQGLAAADAVERAGGEMTFVEADVADASAVKDVVDTAVKA
jgi:NAD(P)-dependent dehydrogenase (short-subunit alcohol dehydrogenase family)